MCLLFLEYLMLKAGLIQSDMDIFSSLRGKQSSRIPFFLFKVIGRKLAVWNFLLALYNSNRSEVTSILLVQTFFMQSSAIS